MGAAYLPRLGLGSKRKAVKLENEETARRDELSIAKSESVRWYREDAIKRLEDVVAFAGDRCHFAVSCLDYLRRVPQACLSKRQHLVLERIEAVVALKKRMGQEFDATDPAKATGRPRGPRWTREENGTEWAPFLKDPSVLPKSPPKRRPSDG